MPPPTPSPMRAGRMPQLDSLRALAVFVVMLWHFTSRETWLRSAAVDAGVRLFFVLSGFLVTAILLQARDDIRAGAQIRGAAARRFYLRRALRIVPIYYLTLLIAVAFGVPDVVQSLWWHAAYLSNVKFVLAGTWAGLASPFWSLSVEEQFYLVWPWLVLPTSTRRLRHVSVAGLLAAPLFRLATTIAGYPVTAEVLPFGCFDALAAGALMSTYWHEGQLDAALLRTRWVTVVSACSLLLLVAGRWSSDALAVISMSLYKTPLSLVLAPVIGRAALGIHGLLGWLLDAPPIRYLGRISYGLYVYHNFIPLVVRGLSRTAGVHVPDTGAPAVAVYLIASVSAASLSWHFVEQPLAKVKARIAA